MSVPEFEKGNTVQIKTTFSDSDDNVVPPDNTEAFMRIIDLDTGTEMVSNTLMTKITDTQYQFNWDTTEGMTTGEYEIKASGEISSDDVVNRDRIKLVDIIDGSGSGTSSTC